MRTARATIVMGVFELILHLLEYRVVPGHEAEVVGYLRRWAPVADPDQGPIVRCFGSRLGTDAREHLAVTVWSGVEAFRHGRGDESVPDFLAANSELLGERRSSRYRVAASTGLGCEGARVLRLYRSAIAVDSVETWERRAIEPIGQLASKEGLLTIVAGVSTDQGGATAQVVGVNIAVLTAWTEWSLLLAATGGRLNSALLDTELVDLERPATADHYEIIEPEPGPD